MEFYAYELPWLCMSARPSLNGTVAVLGAVVTDIHLFFSREDSWTQIAENHREP